MKRSTDNTAQVGVNAVEALFLEMGWLFRRQLESDFGIDAHVEIATDDGPTGQLVALQIKSGRSFFRRSGDDYVYHASARHLSYWENFALPVLLVMHNPDDNETVWCRIEVHRVKMKDDGGGVVSISRYSKLTKNSAEAIIEQIPRSDPVSRRRQRLAADADIIRRASVEEAYLRLDEWVNKSLNWRGGEIVFGEPEGAADVRYPFMAAGYSVTGLVAELFPWADVEYERAPENHAGEVDVHTFQLSVNEFGKAFLRVEDYYNEGAEPRPELVPPDDEGYLDDEDWHDTMFLGDLEKD